MSATSPTQMPAIEVKAVRRTFKVKGGMFGTDRHVVAVDDVSFAVPPGGVLGVVGGRAAASPLSRA